MASAAGVSFSSTVEDYLIKRNALPAPANLYNVLELEPTSSASIIRKAYYHFARIFHPDKAADGGHLTLLNQVKTAYETLGDEYRRMLYDLENGLLSPVAIDDVLAATLDIVKQRYFMFLQEKASVYMQCVTSEFYSGGLVIKRAIYGDLRLAVKSPIDSIATILEEDLQGPFIDVTVQLTVLMNQSMLHVDTGTLHTFAHLPGFYNPLHFLDEEYTSARSTTSASIRSGTRRKSIPFGEDGSGGAEADLYILYMFQNELHEVTFTDGALVTLPRRSHRIFGNYLRGPFAMANLLAVVPS